MSEPAGSILEDERRMSREVERRLQARINDLERVLRVQAIVSIQTVKDLSSLSKKVSSVQKDTELRPQETVERLERPQETAGPSEQPPVEETQGCAHLEERPLPSAPLMPEAWRFGTLVGESKKEDNGPSPFQVHIKPREPPLFTGKKGQDVVTWLSTIDDYFALVDYTESQKVAYLILPLDKNARCLWNVEFVAREH